MIQFRLSGGVSIKSTYLIPYSQTNSSVFHAIGGNRFMLYHKTADATIYFAELNSTYECSGGICTECLAGYFVNSLRECEEGKKPQSTYTYTQQLEMQEEGSIYLPAMSYSVQFSGRTSSFLCRCIFSLKTSGRTNFTTKSPTRTLWSNACVRQLSLVR